ncbi:MAG: hypothetical protein WCB78_24065 [Pseudolabrys sp.]|jgi:hypothetical protein
MDEVMHTGKINRRSNGTIDIDFYRQEAFLLRRQATNKFFRRLGRAGRPLVGVATIIANYALLTPRDPLPPSTNSIFVSANVPLLPTESEKNS